MDWIYCVTIIQLSVNRQSFHQVFHKKNVVKLENDCNVCALRESVNGVSGTSLVTPTMRSWGRNFLSLVVTMFYNNTLEIRENFVIGQFYECSYLFVFCTPLSFFSFLHYL